MSEIRLSRRVWFLATPVRSLSSLSNEQLFLFHLDPSALGFTKLTTGGYRRIYPT